MMVLASFTLLACGDDGGDGDGDDGDGASGGDNVVACTSDDSCMEFHFPAGGNGGVVEQACVDQGGVVSDACEVTPLAGCCVVQNGDAKTCYYGEAYASDGAEVMSSTCASSGGEWQS